MNVQILIDSIVRQTTVLIAQLATSGGVRAPLAHIANQVFVDLTTELDAQGVSRKVGADMFGMALRAYQRKLQRLRESSTEVGQSLWSAVLGFLRGKGIVSRRVVLERFARDDAVLVRSVLHDLTETGLVFRVGAGENTTYRAVTEDELVQMTGMPEEGVDELVWLIVYRNGPLTLSDLRARTKLADAELSVSLERLQRDGRIARSGTEQEAVYTSPEFLVPLGHPVGWEAAVLDHYHAVVRTICRRLEVGGADGGCPVGGSTYTFDVWPGHPLEEEVHSTLSEFRRHASSLRERVEAHNAAHGLPSKYTEVVAYAGQCALPRNSTAERERRDK